MRILVLGVLAAVTGCAAQPESSGTNSEAAPAPAVVFAASSGTSAKAENAAAPAAEFKPPKGYRKRVEGGTTYYCTKVVVLGSRFEKDDCRTQAELQDLAFQREGMRGDMEQRRSLCTSAAGCANP